MDPVITSPSVSVILPTRNRLATLPVAVSSVLAQSWRDLELIVVNDGGQDGTVEYLESLGDSRLRILDLPESLGPAAARNRAISVARAPWLAFQDSDDEWLIDKLHVQMELVTEAGQNVVAVGSTLIRFAGALPEYVHIPCSSDGKLLRDQFVRVGKAYLQSLLLRRDAVQGIQGFDEKLAVRSDIELCFRLLGVGDFIATQQPLVLSNESMDGVSTQTSKRIESTRAIMQRHAGLLANCRGATGYWYYLLARSEIAVQHHKSAVTSLWSSLRHDPMLWKAWALLCLQLLPKALTKRVFSH